jgi:putative transposase
VAAVPPADAWTNSYFVSTVGGAPLVIVKKYIENQKNV